MNRLTTPLPDTFLFMNFYKQVVIIPEYHAYRLLFKNIGGTLSKLMEYTKKVPWVTMVYKPHQNYYRVN